MLSSAKGWFGECLGMASIKGEEKASDGEPFKGLWPREDAMIVELRLHLINLAVNRLKWMYPGDRAWPFITRGRSHRNHIHATNYLAFLYGTIGLQKDFSPFSKNYGLKNRQEDLRVFFEISRDVLAEGSKRYGPEERDVFEQYRASARFAGVPVINLILANIHRKIFLLRNIIENSDAILQTKFADDLADAVNHIFFLELWCREPNPPGILNEWSCERRGNPFESLLGGLAATGDSSTVWAAVDTVCINVSKRLLRDLEDEAYAAAREQILKGANTTDLLCHLTEIRRKR